MDEGRSRLWKGAMEEWRMGLWGGAIDSSAKRHYMPKTGDKGRMGDGSLTPRFRLRFDRREEEFDPRSEDDGASFGVA